jgi:hypothetical protein
MPRMSRSTRQQLLPRPFRFEDRPEEIDLFFQGKGSVHQTLRRVVRRLERAKIPYAVAGGMAVNAHQHHRTTENVDLLLTAKGLAEFRRCFVPKNYANVPGRQRRFVDKIGQVRLNFLVTAHFPGYVSPGPIAFPDPADVGVVIERVRVVNLVTLAQLKLAARRFRDLADVVSLIQVHGLEESFAEQLDPSVRSDFFGFLEETRHEEQFAALQG